MYKFIRFFSVHTSYLSMFPTLRNLSNDELGASSKHRAHASVVMNNIDPMIGNLTEVKCIEEIMLKIVRTHVPRGVE